MDSFYNPNINYLVTKVDKSNLSDFDFFWLQNNIKVTKKESSYESSTTW